jgi:hypothetical protein
LRKSTLLRSATVFASPTNTLEQMAEATRARGYEYFGLADQSAHYAGGLSLKEIEAQHAEILGGGVVAALGRLIGVETHPVRLSKRSVEAEKTQGAERQSSKVAASQEGQVVPTGPGIAMPVPVSAWQERGAASINLAASQPREMASAVAEVICPSQTQW